MAKLAIICAALLLVGAHAEVEEEEGVQVLTTDNWDEAVKEDTTVLVEFYAPWCGHCKSLAPEYVKAAAELKSSGSEVRLAKVDATVESKLGEKYGVQGYPTLKFFKNGVQSEYNGGRTAPEIVSWLKKKTGPPATLLDSTETAKDFVEGKDVVVIGFFGDKESDLAKAFIKAAEGIDDVPFGIAGSDLIEEYEAKLDSIVLLKTFDEKRNVYSGDASFEDIAEFVKANQMPLVTEFTDESAPKIFGGDVKVHLLYFEAKSSDTYQAHIDVLRAVAGDFKGKILFVTIDADVDDNERIMEFFNVKKETTPAYRLVKLSEEDMKKFAPDSDEVTEETVRKFVTDYLDGNLKPHFASEEVPADWDSKPVKVLVGKNFEEQVIESDKAVMVEFYAPWCGHCKQLAPIWDQLGEHYESKDDVLIAKMDSTVNEISHVQVQSFPTIYYFPKGDKTSPIDFKGSRTLDGFIKFIDSNGTEGNGDGQGEGDEDADMGEEPTEEEPSEEDLAGLEADESLEGAEDEDEAGHDEL